jgi:hypothetical protein
MEQDIQKRLEKNLDYIKQSVSRAGFGGIFDQAIEAGIKTGAPQLDLPPATKTYSGGEMMEWVPKITENRNSPGFYNFNGYQASRITEGGEAHIQFVSIYKMSGMTIEQSRNALAGATVLHSEWNDKTEKRGFVYSRLDMSATPKAGENYPVISMDSNNIDLARLLSKEDIVGDTRQKEDLLNRLQSGERVQVTIKEKRVGEENPTYPKVFLQLNLTNSTTMGLRVTDSDNRLLRTPELKGKDLSVTVGLTLKGDHQPEIPKGVLKMLSGDRTPKTPGHGKSVA